MGEYRLSIFITITPTGNVQQKLHQKPIDTTRSLQTPGQDVQLTVPADIGGKYLDLVWPTSVMRPPTRQKRRGPPPRNSPPHLRKVHTSHEKSCTPKSASPGKGEGIVSSTKRPPQGNDRAYTLPGRKKGVGMGGGPNHEGKTNANAVPPWNTRQGDSQIHCMAFGNNIRGSVPAGGLYATVPRKREC